MTSVSLEMDPTLIRETRAAAEAGTLEIIEVGKGKVVISERTTGKVLVDNLRSRKHAFEELKLIYRAEKLLEEGTNYENSMQRMAEDNWPMHPQANLPQ